MIEKKDEGGGIREKSRCEEGWARKGECGYKEIGEWAQSQLEDIKVRVDSLEEMGQEDNHSPSCECY
jgi:hypothetical protein